MIEWVISDTHFNHEMLVREGFRNFKNVDNMNEYIICRWNKYVSPEDTVYFLGDFAFTNDKALWVERLNGNIIFVKGNHDPNTVSNVQSLVIRFRGEELLLIHNPTDSAGYPQRTVIHGHIHEGGFRTFVKKPKKTYFNVNLEFHNYKPIKLSEVVGLIKSGKEREYINRN